MQVKNEDFLQFRSSCPISSTLDLVGDKWSFLIIRDIAFLGKKTFGELSAAHEKIASNILSNRLKFLTDMGILNKGKMEGNKKTNIYTLTDKGLDLVPVMAEYIIWGVKHFDHIDDKAKKFAVELRKNKEKIIKEAMKNYRDNKDKK